MSEHAPGVTVRALGFPPPFFSARLIVVLLALLPLSVTLAAGGGLASFAWLVVPLVVSAIPERCVVTERGFELRWAFWSQTIDTRSIESVALVDDPRRWVLGARQPVLELRRPNARPLLLSATGGVLSELCAQARSKHASSGAEARPRTTRPSIEE